MLVRACRRRAASWSSRTNWTDEAKCSRLWIPFVSMRLASPPVCAPYIPQSWGFRAASGRACSSVIRVRWARPAVELANTRAHPALALPRAVQEAEQSLLPVCRIGPVH